MTVWSSSAVRVLSAIVDSKDPGDRVCPVVGEQGVCQRSGALGGALDRFGSPLSAGTARPGTKLCAMNDSFDTGEVFPGAGDGTVVAPQRIRCAGPRCRLVGCHVPHVAAGCAASRTRTSRPEDKKGKGDTGRPLRPVT